jgi:isoquinoline 1-oxidoreductase subunit alpha
MLSLKINNQTFELEVPEDMPLLWAIRDFALLHGTKYGCGMAQCGACSVLIDGVSVRSCITPVSQAVGKSITTVEGLEEQFAKLQDAWEAESVPQCGYCQPGQLVSAAALIKENPKPTDEDIDRAMSGNICRCGTYTRIRKAIHRACEHSK